MILRGPDDYLVVSLETKSPAHLPQASCLSCLDLGLTTKKGQVTAAGGGHQWTGKNPTTSLSFM